MYDIVKTIITVLFSGSFLAFIQFLIGRFDKRHDRLADLKKDIDEGLDSVRKVSDTRFNQYLESLEKAEESRKQSYADIQSSINQLIENDNRFSKNIEQMSAKQNIVASANVGLIHNEIISFTNPIIERNAVTYGELATLDSLYIPYSKLGGNGECKRRYEDVNKLPKLTKEEALEKDRELETKRFAELHKDVQQERYSD